MNRLIETRLGRFSQRATVVGIVNRSRAITPDAPHNLIGCFRT